MDLTPEQLAAALACGCALAPATEDQVRRLAAQRRVFRIEGRPVVASRDGFLETHGTLSALIEKHRLAAAGPNAGTAAAPVQEHAVPSGPELSHAAAEPEVARAQQDDAETPPAKPRPPRARRPKPPAASADAVPTGRTVAASSEA